MYFLPVTFCCFNYLSIITLLLFIKGVNLLNFKFNLSMLQPLYICLKTKSIKNKNYLCIYFIVYNMYLLAFYLFTIKINFKVRLKIIIIIFLNVLT